MVKTDTRALSDLAGLDGIPYTDTSEVIGKTAAMDLAQNQILIAGTNVLNAGSAVDGKSLATVIDKGFVGIGMEVDQTNGVGTLIVPGDRVDILLTVYVDELAISVKDLAGTQISTGGTAVTSKLILENCKIIQTLLPPVPPVTTTTTLANGSPAPVVLPTTPLVQFNDRHMLAIVEVTPEQAEVIRWAQRTESKAPQTYIDLAFALRSSQDNGTDPLSNNPGVSVPGVTFTEIVAKYGVLPPDPLGTLPTLLGKKIAW
jgi:Flp pilus assembly protein CpaB